MTCIAAVQCDDGVLIGWDSFLGDYSECVTDRCKVIESCGVHFGIAGSARFQQLVEYYLKVKPPRPGGVEAWAVTRLVPELRNLTEQQGLWKDFSDSEAWSPEPLCLIVAAGKLLVLQQDWFVYEPVEGYAAVGAGSAFALGALAATRGHSEARLRRVLRAASRHCPGVREPVHTAFIPA